MRYQGHKISTQCKRLKKIPHLLMSPRIKYPGCIKYKLIFFFCNLGHCRNVGFNLGEYFWKNSTECPDGDGNVWSTKHPEYSNNVTTKGHLVQIGLRISGVQVGKSQSSTSRLGYVRVKSGKHRRQCVWRHTRHGFRCIKRKTPAGTSG